MDEQLKACSSISWGGYSEESAESDFGYSDDQRTLSPLTPYECRNKMSQNIVQLIWSEPRRYGPISICTNIK